MEFAIHVSKSFLPSEGSAFSASRTSQSIEMDTEDDDDNEENDDERRGGGGGKGQNEEGEDGFDVTLWKKVAEPIELKKVWKAVMGRLPSGMVTAT